MSVTDDAFQVKNDVRDELAESLRSSKAHVDEAALGRAIVDEVIRSYIDRAWLGPLRSSPDPVEGIAAILEGMSSGDEKISELGCPLNNLVQELSVTDDAFQVKLQRLIDDVRDELAESLRSSKARGYVDMSVDCDAAGLAKGARDPAVIRLCGRGMSIYLDALRPGGRPGAATVRERLPEGAAHVAHSGNRRPRRVYFTAPSRRMWLTPVAAPGSGTKGGSQ